MVNRVVRADGTTEITNIKTLVYTETTNFATDLRPGGVYSAVLELEVYGGVSDSPEKGEALTYYQTDNNGVQTLIGVFYAEPAITTKTTYKVTAYDAANKLDVDYSARLYAIQSSFPMTLSALVADACSVAGVTLATSTFPNSTLEVGEFYADGVTCRQIVGWAAEIACRFARCNTSGSIVFDWYTSASDYRVYPSSGTSDDNETYVAYKQDGLQYEKFSCKPADSVAVQPPLTTSAAFIYPPSVTAVYATDPNTDNCLIITGNLLLTSSNSTVCTQIAQYIFNTMRELPTYRPCTVNVFPGENPLRAGDIVSVTDIQGVSFTTIITSCVVKAEYTQLSSTGNEEYEKNYYGGASNQLVNLSAGLNNTKVELEFTERSIKSTVAEAQSKYDEESYNVTLYGYNDPETAGYKASSHSGAYYLNQYNGYLYLSNGATWNYVKTLSLITDNLSSSITQLPDNITLSVTNGNTSSTITLSGDNVTTQSKTINMTGLVSFTDLSTSGSTTINGANITTGTISADRIDTANLTVNAANISGELTIGQLPSTVAETSDIPTNVSELTNDSGYQTSAQVTTITNNTIATTNVVAQNLTVKAANIDGTLTAAQIKLYGEMTVYQDSALSTSGGSLGYMSGSTKDSSGGTVYSTTGMGIKSGNNHLIVTNSGVRATLYYSSAYYSVYLASGNFVVTNNVTTYLNGHVYVGGYLRLNGGGVSVYYNSTTEIVTMFNSGSTGYFKMYSSSSNALVNLYTTSYGATLQLNNTSGSTRAQLFLNASSVGILRLYNSGGSYKDFDYYTHPALLLSPSVAARSSGTYWNVSEVANYNFFIIEYCWSTDYTTHLASASVYISSASGSGAVHASMVWYDSGIVGAYRLITIDRSAGTFTLGAGYYMSSSTYSTNTKYIIPTRVFGMNV